jgi:type III restriction enzyme
MVRSRKREARPEDYIVRRLIDYPDIDYGQHADLLYDLAGQVVAHLRSYLSAEDASDVLEAQDELLARVVHTQMQAHYEEGVEEGYDIVVKRGWTALKESAFTATADQAPLDFRIAPPDKSNMARYVFGGFRRCLYRTQKFQSDAERRLAIVLDRDSLKWFKPAKGQFQIFYRRGADHPRVSARLRGGDDRPHPDAGAKGDESARRPRGGGEERSGACVVRKRQPSC